MYLFNLGICVFIINKMSSLIFVQLRHMLNLNTISATLFHSFITGFLSGSCSVLFVQYSLNAFSLQTDVISMHLASAIIIVFYIVAYYLMISSGNYYILAEEMVMTKNTDYQDSAEYLKIETERELRNSHALSVIGLILGFAIILSFWGYFQIDSLTIKIIVGYLFLGLISTIEYSGRKLPGSAGYLATFFWGIFLWPLIRFQV